LETAKSHRLSAAADDDLADSYMARARQLRASLIGGGSGGRAHARGGSASAAASAAAQVIVRWYRLVRCRHHRLAKLVPFGACGECVLRRLRGVLWVCQAACIGTPQHGMLPGDVALTLVPVSRDSCTTVGTTQTDLFMTMCTTTNADHLADCRLKLSEGARRFLDQVPDAQQYPLLIPAPLFGRSTQQGAEVRARVLRLLARVCVCLLALRVRVSLLGVCLRFRVLISSTFNASTVAPDCSL
jgi:hypothetical protein